METKNKLIDAFAEFASGKPIILLNDGSSYPESAIVCLAGYAEPEIINMMIQNARGIVSVAVTEKLAGTLKIPAQNSLQTDRSAEGSRNYLVSIDANETTTGISAEERSLSIKKLAQTHSAAGFRKPGHIFPVTAAKEGLYKNISVIEGSLDLARLNGCMGMVAICDILSAQGHMADSAETMLLGETMHLPVITLSEFIVFMLKKDGLLDSRKSVDIVLDRTIVRLMTYRVQHHYFQIGMKCSETSDRRLEMANMLHKLKNVLGGFEEAVAALNPFIAISPGSIVDMLERLADPKTGLVFSSSAPLLPKYIQSMILKFILQEMKRELNEWGADKNNRLAGNAYKSFTFEDFVKNDLLVI